MPSKAEYKGVKILILKGDITKVEADAIVNPANSLMIMGGGVAGAIKRVEGEEIEKEAMRYVPVPIGEAVVTRTRRLKAKYVIHAPTMERPAMRTTIDKVRKAVEAALKKASELNLSSIAFPGMGTGVGGLSYDKASEVMVRTIREHVNSGTSLRTVLLVAYDEGLYEAFRRAVERLLKV
ncbi:MAG: macro domain-containing protein [Thermoprotei archaeon]|nr:MAG: macro domain-containing protein [Thermoprotei archaeon]RLF23682.1 MAG: macro domain-containing protein [Thermoprotei archaeon]